jgi:hypothetical protein
MQAPPPPRPAARLALPYLFVQPPLDIAETLGVGVETRRLEL